MRRKLLLLSHVMMDNNDITPKKRLPSLDNFATWSYSQLSQLTGSGMNQRVSYQDDSVRDVWLVNGQYQPTLTVSPGEWVVLDIVCASGDRILEIELRTGIGSNSGTSACDRILLALDGVYLQVIALLVTVLS